MRILLVLAMVMGCREAGSEQPPHSYASSGNDDELALRFHMNREYDLQRAIERSLIRGKLDDAQALARSLAHTSDPPALEGWARQTELVRDRALALAGARGIDDACRLSARVSEACASCHASAEVAPIFGTVPPAPPDQPTLEARMARHRWAIDRIWEGMVGNAPGPWKRGLDVLAATPLPYSAIDADRSALATRLQQLASDASRKPEVSASARAQVYGELLVTCAACHSGKAATSE